MDLTTISPLISLIFLLIVGLGLGATTTIDDFRSALRKPKAVVIGFLSQYLFMPIAAYVLTLIFQLDNMVAVGVILIGCSPGGTTSNLFSYWSHGDVALSITMSLLSTCAAFFMMPLWVFILVKLALGSSVKVAWTNMVISLLLIVIPTILGLYIRKTNTERKIAGKFIWKWIEIFASLFGILFLIASILIAILAYGNILAIIPWSLWVLSVIVLPLGCIFGYFMSRFLGMSSKDQRTISLETGIQNFALTVAIVQLSFTDDETTLKYAIMFPIIYGFTYLFWAPVFTVIFRFYLAPKDGEIIEEEKPMNNQTDTNIPGDFTEDKKVEKILKEDLEAHQE